MADHKKGARKLVWRKIRRKQVEKADVKEEDKSKDNSGEKKTKNTGTKGAKSEQLSNPWIWKSPISENIKK